MNIKAWLNQHWKTLVWFSLLIGLTGMLLHSWLIIDASQHTGVIYPKWVTEVDYNFYGEGPFELILFPASTLFIGVTIYVFWEKYKASLT